MALFRYGGMCTHLAADRSALIFTGEKKRKRERWLPHCPHSAHWLLQSPGSLWIFPCPAIFSQVLIFSFCQARSRQPPRRFQRSGLHANCLSIARLPPTYIMHLVSSAQSGLHHFGSFKFGREEEDCKSNAWGYGRAKQAPKGGEKNDSLLRFWRKTSVGGLTGGTFWRMSCVWLLLC